MERQNLAVCLRLCLLTGLLLLTLIGARAAQAAATIDIMIVYDRTAATWVQAQGGTQAFALDAVGRMNQAARNSGLNLEFRLVHVMTSSYSTFGSLSTDLRSLQAGSGSFAEVHQARDRHGADLVAMLVDTGSAYGHIGQGYILSQWSGDPDYAFTTNAIRSVAITHTLTHEVGHNLGADHARNQQSPGPGPLANYAAGYYFTGTNGVNYHTIMAYDFDSQGRRYQPAPLFSTPLQLHQGVPAGDAISDNTRLIRKTKHIVAAYRSSVSSPPPTPPDSIGYPSTSSTGQITITWSAVDNATGYQLERSGNGGQSWTRIYSGTNTQYQDTLQNGSYQYRVRGTNAQGESLWRTGSTLVVNIPVPPPPEDPTDPTRLTNGTTITGIGAARDAALYYYISVPAGATNLRIETFGGSGDLDLFMRQGSRPTTMTYDCRSILFDNNESCEEARPVGGNYYIMLYAYSTFSGASLRVTYDAPGDDKGPDPQARRTLQKFYITYYGRPADPGGLAFWASQMKSGDLPFNDLIAAFGSRQQPEFARIYGVGLTSAQFFQTAYTHILNRSIEPAGLDFWLSVYRGYLGQGMSPDAARARILIQIVEGITGGADGQFWADKMTLAEEVTDMALQLPSTQRSSLFAFVRSDEFLFNAPALRTTEGYQLARSRLQARFQALLSQSGRSQHQASPDRKY